MGKDNAFFEVVTLRYPLFFTGNLWSEFNEQIVTHSITLNYNLNQPSCNLRKKIKQGILNAIVDSVTLRQFIQGGGGVRVHLRNKAIHKEIKF